MTSEKPITDTELDRLVGAALSRAASDAAAPALAARIAEQAMLQSQDRYPVAAAQIGWGENLKQQLGIRHSGLILVPSATALAASAVVGFMLGAGTLSELGAALPVIGDELVDPLETTDLALNWQDGFGSIYPGFDSGENFE